MFRLASPARREICAHCRLSEKLARFRLARTPKNACLTQTSRFQQRIRPFSTRKAYRQEIQAREKEHGRDGFSDYFAEEHRVPGVRKGEAPSEDYSAYDKHSFGLDFKRVLVDQLNRLELDVSTLGNPSRALRLPPRKPRIEKESVILQEADMNQPVDVLSLLQIDGNSIDEEVAFENIDLIRDRWLSRIDPSKPPSQEECIKVYKTLNRSFKVDQLEAYLDATARDEADDFDDLQGVLSTESCSRSRWYPGKSNMEKTYVERLFADVAPPDDWRILEPDTRNALRRQSQSTMTKKPTICEAIMRRSWKLRSAEECQRQGELDVAVKAEQLSFLESTFQLTRQIEQQLKVSFEFRRDRNVFRIRGTHEKCRQAFMILFAPLGAIRTMRIELEKNIRPPTAVDYPELLGAARLWDDKFLEEIASSTKTKIIPAIDEEGSITALDVMYLAPQRADGGHETTIFENVRLIIEKVKSDQSNESTIEPLVHENVSCHRVPVQGSTSLPIFHRSSNWSRMRADEVNAPKSSEDAVIAADLAVGLRTGMAVLDPWRHIGPASQQEITKMMQITEFEPQVWNYMSTSSISIRTGKLALEGSIDQDPQELQLQPSLEPIDLGEQEPQAANAAAVALKSQQRAFIPSAPGGMSSFALLNEAKATSEQRIVLTLRPTAVLLDTDDSANAERDVTKLPDMRIELSASTDERGAASILDARLVSAFPSVEVLMPEEEFDLQLTTQPHIRYVQGQVEGNLARFVDQLVINDGRLDTRSIPSDLEVTIPTLAKRVNRLEEYGPRSFAFLAGRELDEDKQRLMSRSKLPWNLRRPAPTAADLAPSGFIESQDLVDASSHDMLVDEERDGAAAADARDLEHYVDDDDIDDVRLGLEPWEPHLRSITSGFAMFVRYKYTSVEYHSRLRGRFRGFPLTYSIVDAGGIGGRYEDLSLEARESGEFVGIFDDPLPDRVMPRTSVEKEDVDGESQEQQLSDEDAAEGMLADSDEAEPDHESPTETILQRYKASKELREKDHRLEWFLPFWEAALSLVRKSRQNADSPK